MPLISALTSSWMNDDPKNILRKQILPARKILSRTVWEERNKLLYHKVFSFLEKNPVNIVHVFLPIERNKEVNTWPIIKSLMDQNKKIVVSSTDLKNETMNHFYYNSQLKFKLNRLKIPEPVNAVKADIKSIDMILMPLLAADKVGNRIGYGKGYYDRLLKDLPEMNKVGLSLGPLFDAFNFAESHDIRLDYCITPFEIHPCQ
ncbi:MAG: 5-formyltetrahydrofolate cyclo-ligase [Bacteroidota bacterium]